MTNGEMREYAGEKNKEKRGGRELKEKAMKIK